MSFSRKQSKQQKNGWRGDGNERHYCELCNAWMGGDRQSILLHENGKKHRENVEKSLRERRDNKSSQDQAAKLLQKSLRAMNEAAASAHLQQDVGTYGMSGLESLIKDQTTPSAACTVVPTRKQVSDSNGDKSSKAKEEDESKKSWEERKKRRREETTEESDSHGDSKMTKRKLATDEGHYILDDVKYLEGQIYVDVIEEEMPVQVWVGPGSAAGEEMKLPARQHYWREALVLSVRRRSKEGKFLDLAYLATPLDEEETLEKSVPPRRIRIVLGNSQDERIPKTLEEARLAVMGEEVIKVNQQDDGATREIDENTGFSAWGTVEIRKTTVRKEAQVERERERAQRKAERERVERERKEAMYKRMDEAKVLNAEDSALGAYDVWSTGEGGYKGFDISNGDGTVKVEDTANSLSKGMGPVAFKKKKKLKRKQGRRTTSAEDD